MVIDDEDELNLGLGNRKCNSACTFEVFRNFFWNGNLDLTVELRVEFHLKSIEHLGRGIWIVLKSRSRNVDLPPLTASTGVTRYIFGVATLDVTE